MLADGGLGEGAIPRPTWMAHSHLGNPLPMFDSQLQAREGGGVWMDGAEKIEKVGRQKDERVDPIILKNLLRLCPNGDWWVGRIANLIAPRAFLENIRNQ